jgi:hypothetical protein
MAKRLYHFLINSFLVITIANYKLAFKIGTYTDNALNNAKADPAILLLYNFFHPLFLNFMAAYNASKLQKNQAIGGTLTLTQLFDGLTDKLNIWDSQILVFYTKKSNPGFKALFPQGHKPFQQGSQETKIEAIKNLSDGMNGIAGLASVKSDVDAYYALFIAAFNTHQGQDSSIGTASDLVETQRVNMCNGLQWVLGGLTQKYYTNLSQIANFIDIASMQNGEQNKWVKKLLKGLKLLNIFERTLDPTDKLRIKNNKLGPLQFFCAKNAGDAVGAVFVIVNPGEEVTHPIADFGDFANNHFFNVYNPTDLDGGYEVELM